MKSTQHKPIVTARQVWHSFAMPPSKCNCDTCHHKQFFGRNRNLTPVLNLDWGPEARLKMSLWWRHHT